jgi:hypothetical protein
VQIEWGSGRRYHSNLRQPIHCNYSATPFCWRIDRAAGIRMMRGHNLDSQSENAHLQRLPPCSAVVAIALIVSYLDSRRCQESDAPRFGS